MFDAGYEPNQLAEELATSHTCAAILVRLRSGRCFYGDPPSPDECGTGRGTPGGRPRRHGMQVRMLQSGQLAFSNLRYQCQDAQYGQVKVRALCGLHSKTQSHATIGTRQARPISKGTLVLVEVSRLPRKTREPQVLWLWYWGPDADEPDLDLLWRSYVRRFDLEHTFRFLKQTLNWTTPRIRHPEQADRWSWLVLAAYTQLRLTRSLVADQRLPWERLSEAGATYPLPSAKEVLATSPGAWHTCKVAETLRTLAWQTQRSALGSC